MAIENWLDMYGMTQEVDKVCKEKPPAIAYIDDRAICFDGHPETLLKKIQNFQPWYKMPTLTPQNEPSLLEFDVVDTTTGKYPDWERIAREESWAKGLVYCDMDGIAIREDGSLILLDECGNCVSCPPDRFEIRRRPPEGEENT